MMPEPYWYLTKETQSGTGILQYRTEMIDAGIPMPAALVDADAQLWIIVVWFGYALTYSYQC
jgi:hypothetical protein